MKLFLKILGGLFVLLASAFAVFVVVSNYKLARQETRAFDEGATGRYVTVEGYRWHVATKGDTAADPTGAPVLLLHGFIPAGHESFFPWADKLAAQRALIMPDYLSYGRSERVTTPGGYYALPHTAAALAAILDELGVARVDIVGHSYGTMIANQFAVLYPERVRRMVLMGAMSYLPPTPIEDVIQLPFGIGRAVAWNIVGGGPAGYVSLLCRNRPDCSWWRSVEIKDTTDSLRAAMYISRHTPYLADLPSKLGEVAAPTLVLNGENDFLIPQADARRLAESVRDGRVEFIPGANHMPYVQKPDEVLKAVTGFLQPST